MLLRSLIVLVCCSTGLSAQSVVPDKPAAPASHAAPDVPASPHDAPSPSRADLPRRPGCAPTSVTLALAGLSEENLPAVRQMFAALEQRVFVCPECHSTAARKGVCEECDQRRLAHDAPVLDQIELDAVHGMARLRVGSSRSLRLSELPKPLKKLGVSIDPVRQPVSDGTLLWVAGVIGRGVLNDLVAVLEGPGYFASVGSHYQKGRRAARLVVHTGEHGVSQQKLGRALAEVDQLLELADMVWGQESADAAAQLAAETQRGRAGDQDPSGERDGHPRR